MITNLSHATLFVKDLDTAKEFYTERLGFEVRADMPMGETRWLTVSPPNQPDVELVLMKPVANPLIKEEHVSMLNTLLDAGAMGTKVFRTRDCQKTFEAYRERGVEFVMEPTEQPYGIEALFKDNSGNLFSLVQITN
jgi:predicted enzyme related to lactoylglutathione lyase